MLDPESVHRLIAKQVFRAALHWDKVLAEATPPAPYQWRVRIVTAPDRSTSVVMSLLLIDRPVPMQAILAERSLAISGQAVDHQAPYLDFVGAHIARMMFDALNEADGRGA